MFKKILLLILFSCLSIPCYAVKPASDTKGKLMPIVQDIDAMAIGQTKKYGDFSEYPSGLVYAKFYTPGADVNADFAKGEAINTFTVSRSASNPATYFNETGAMITVTDSNTLRSNNRGFYNETGWNLRQGLLLEGAGTNNVTNSKFSGDADSNGFANNWEAERLNSADAAESRGLIDVSSQFGAGVYGQYIKINQTNTSSIGIYSVKDFFIHQGFNASSGNVTCSVFVKGNFTSTGFSFRLFQYNNTTYVTSSTGGQLEAFINNNTFTRLSQTFNITNENVTGVAIALSINKIGTGEQCDVTYVLPQLEKSLYASSPIPTTTAPLSRNYENLTINATNNFAAPYGNNVLSFDGASSNVSISNNATTNQINGCNNYSIETWVFIRSDGEGDAGRIISKLKDTHIRTSSESGDNVSIVSAVASEIVTPVTTVTNVPKNTWNHIVSVFDNTTHNITMSVNNVAYTGSPAIGNITDDSSNPWIIGNNLSSDRTFNGFIKTVRLYRNKALNPTEITTLYNAGMEASINSTNITGCTAEYLFKEGTGTVLTDSVYGNNGTINGATWSKDKMQGTVLMAYCPIMMANEQSSNYKGIFQLPNLSPGNNYIKLNYGDNSFRQIQLTIQSNSVNYYVSGESISAWNRYSPQIIVGGFGDYPNVAGNRTSIFVDGAYAGNRTSFAIPSGTNITTMNVQPDSGQAMILGAIMVWDRRLSADEVKVTTNLIKERLRWN